jgi:hypothetical protein
MFVTTSRLGKETLYWENGSKADVRTIMAISTEASCLIVLAIIGQQDAYDRHETREANKPAHKLPLPPVCNVIVKDR